MQIDHYDEAIDLSQSAYQAAMDLGADDLAQAASGNLGWANYQLGDDEKALQQFVEAEKSARKLGDIRNELKWISNAGYVSEDTGDLSRAAQSYRQALSLARQIDGKEDIAIALGDLARVSVESGKLDEAGAYIDQIVLMERAGNNRLSVDVVLTQGMLAAARRQDQQAETMLSAVQSDPESPTTNRLEAGNDLAGLYELQGNTKNAEQIYKITLATFESARAQLKKEESKLPFVANATRIYDDYIHFLIEHGRSDEALALADQSRALTLAQGLGVATANVRLQAGGSQPTPDSP